MSGQMHQFQGNNQELRELAQRPLFAVRRGVLKFKALFMTVWCPDSRSVESNCGIPRG